MLRHRAWTPFYLVRYLRFAAFRLRTRSNPYVVTEGFVFLGRGTSLQARPGYGRLVLGRWVHVGDGTRLAAHEGTLRVGDKCVFASRDTVTCYLDVEIGPATLVAADVYVTDFDHRFDELDRPIKDQGIVKSPVRIGAGCWLGTKVVVTRGSTIGAGTVVGASSVVRGELPADSVAVGAPARVVKDRRAAWAAEAARRAALADIARKTARAAAR